MTIKLVAIDLDDTLLDPELKITPRTRRVLQEIERRGVRVVLATGRMYRATAPYAAELGLKGPLITYQGAWVKNFPGEEELLHLPVPLDLAREVLDYLYPLGFHLQVYVNDTLCFSRLTPEGERYACMCRVRPRIVGDLRRFLREPPTKVLMVAPEEEIDRLLPELEARYRSVLSVGKSKPYFLEIAHPRATKGEALAYLAEYFGLRPEEVMAIGDSYNDLPMFRFAGLAVAMGNARPEIKAEADFVTASNAEEGVAEALEKFVLGGKA
ncbi:Cof-type HAD-IIB family hydrolase [Ammonifex thiophilus]|uniref:HAD family phosphatase n=1 Tax=Ammonifex thiophilus TaxID=444093 RepID=A0A3D8P4Q4_9THEO|nr:Cof-type HAD-IIB family hydrolase [Ammonifex thiophilus]RDV84196.1 HAD family phosphatase [Ammonifex thiophilus]